MGDLLFCDSFEHYSTADEFRSKWNTNSSFPSITTSDKRHGSRCLTWSLNTISYNHYEEIPTAVFGFAMKTTGQNAARDIRITKGGIQPGWNPGVLIENIQNNYAQIRHYLVPSYPGVPIGSVTIYKYSGAFFLPISMNNWYYYEIKVNFPGLSSSWTTDVYLNEELLISYTNSAFTEEVNYHQISHFEIMADGYPTYLDDVYVSDGDVYGDVTIGCIVPDGDTATKDWTRSAGSDNYALVNEKPADTTTYVYTDTVGNKDIYTLEDVDPAIEIKGLQMVVLAEKEDSGLANFQGIWKPAATEYNTPTMYPGTDEFTFFKHCQTLNPETGLAWTASEVNDLEVGIEKTT